LGGLRIHCFLVQVSGKDSRASHDWESFQSAKRNRKRRKREIEKKRKKTTREKKLKERNVPIWKNHLFISASSIVVYLLVGFGT
jgi:uncharacterized protein (DUF1800 family)